MVRYLDLNVFVPENISELSKNILLFFIYLLDKGRYILVLIRNKIEASDKEHSDGRKNMEEYQVHLR